MSDFELGQRVRVTKKLVKGYDYAEGNTFWEDAYVIPVEGIVAGYRYISAVKSWIERDFDEYGALLGAPRAIETVPNTSRRYWIVYWHPRRKPYHVPDDGIEAV